MPNYLIIILNRGKGNIFNCIVDIPKEFITSNYVEKEICTFKLIGIVSHFGESGMGGHFIAFCEHNIDKKWRCYNDSIVTECKDDYLKKGTPYILFYKKISTKIKKSNKNIYSSVNLNNPNLQPKKQNIHKSYNERMKNSINDFNLKNNINKNCPNNLENQKKVNLNNQNLNINNNLIFPQNNNNFQQK